MAENNENKAKRQPVHVVRMGLVQAAVWSNAIRNSDSAVFNTTLSRSYHDDGEWRDTKSLRRDDLLVAAKALNEAHTWILHKEDEQRQSA